MAADPVSLGSNFFSSVTMRRRSRRNPTLVCLPYLMRGKAKSNVLMMRAGMSNTSDFIIKKEDHTIGNLLSEHLKMHPQVSMAGYKGELAARARRHRSSQRGDADSKASRSWSS